MTRPWSLPDVRDVAIALAIYHAGIIALAWWAGDRTAVKRIAAAMECPGPEPVARRVIRHDLGRVECVYHREVRKDFIARGGAASPPGRGAQR